MVMLLITLATGPGWQTASAYLLGIAALIGAVSSIVFQRRASAAGKETAAANKQNADTLEHKRQDDREAQIDRRSEKFTDQLQAQLNAVSAKYDALQSRVENQSTRIAELEEALEKMRAERRRLEQHSEDQDATIAQLRADVSVRDARITELEAEVKVLRSMFQEAQPRRRTRPVSAEEGGAE